MLRSRRSPAKSRYYFAPLAEGFGLGTAKSILRPAADASNPISERTPCGAQTHPRCPTPRNEQGEVAKSALCASRGAITPARIDARGKWSKRCGDRLERGPATGSAGGDRSGCRAKRRKKIRRSNRRDQQRDGKRRQSCDVAVVEKRSAVRVGSLEGSAQGICGFARVGSAFA